jgi:hypothetical protein
MVQLFRKANEIACRGCGKFDDRSEAADGPWFLLDVETKSGVCRDCAEQLGYEPRALILLGREEAA